MINAPLTTAGRCEIEKSEAIHDGQFASIQERKEASWRMRYEVRDGHVAREDERNWTSEQPKHDQHRLDSVQVS
jgi:hypothetical protein